MIVEIDGSGQRQCLKKIWWDYVEENVKNFGLS